MTYESLLAAVLAAPDDDLPRLVYADWLAEHGDAERAEFIRVQCELAGYDDVKPIAVPIGRMPAPLPMLGLFFGGRPITEIEIDRALKCRRLIQREAELFHECLRHQQQLFTKPVWNTIEPAGIHLQQFLSWFHRGFIRSIRCTTNQWLTHAPSIIDQNPIQQVTLTTYPDFRINEWEDRYDRAYRIDIQLPGETLFGLGDRIALRDIHQQPNIDIIAIRRQRLIESARQQIFYLWPNINITYDVPNTMPPTLAIRQADALDREVFQILNDNLSPQFTVETGEP